MDDGQGGLVDTVDDCWPAVERMHLFIDVCASRVVLGVVPVLGRDSTDFDTTSVLGGNTKRTGSVRFDNKISV